MLLRDRLLNLLLSESRTLHHPREGIMVSHTRGVLWQTCSDSNNLHNLIFKDTARTKTRLQTMRSYFLAEETEALLKDSLFLLLSSVPSPYENQFHPLSYFSTSYPSTRIAKNMMQG
jgi:hypothetical protein